jgi:hypothetical protein
MRHCEIVLQAIEKKRKICGKRARDRREMLYAVEGAPKVGLELENWKGR